MGRDGRARARTNLNGDALLAVDGLAGDHVPGAERVLLGLGYEDAVVLVRDHHHLVPALEATTPPAAATAATAPPSAIPPTAPAPTTVPPAAPTAAEPPPAAATAPAVASPSKSAASCVKQSKA